MKKSLFLLGAAVAAFASCTNEEVVEMASNRAINFSGFVNNNTRAVTELTKDNLSKFYVFGSYDQTGDNPIWNNAGVSSAGIADKTMYWQEGKDHSFAAYSDGNSIIDNADYNYESKTLTFAGYAAGDNDLIAAIPEVVEGTTVTAEYNTKVNLSFYHMLSQVKFTFNTTDAENYTLAITNLQIADATTAADGTYVAGAAGDKGTIAWNNPTSGTISLTGAALADVANANGVAESDAKLVIPQSNKDLVVTFHAKLTDVEENVIAESDLQGSLAYSSTAAGTVANEWTPGFRYNYTATVNGSTIDDTKPIEFTVDAVEGWKDADETIVTPSKQN